LPLDLPISLGGLAFAGLLRPNRYGSTKNRWGQTPLINVASVSDAPVF
jgi:hypothetical protein